MKRENIYRPSREKVNKLANPFLAIESQRQYLGYLFPSIRGMPQNDTIRVVRGDKSRTIQDFFNEVSAAFQFPSYFGENWDAFDECINDLDWLPAADSYLLIVTNSDQLLSKESARDFKILMDILEVTAKNWEAGINHDILVRAYQEEVVPKSAKFAILLQHSPDADLSGHFGSWLKEVDIPKIDESIFDTNISELKTAEPFHELEPLVREFAPESVPILEMILQGKNVKREDTRKLIHTLEDKILPYRTASGISDPKMAHFERVIRRVVHTL